MEKITAEKTPTRFVMLQKRLQEIESDLAAVFPLPIDPAAADHAAFDDVRERLAFLDKLRAAEGGSDQSPRTSDQLRDIDERIARLKAAFPDWNQPGSFGDDEDDGDGGGDGDAPSVCSNCTMQLPLEELSGRNLFDEEEEEEEEEEKEVVAVAVAPARMWRGIGKYCGAFGGGVVVGAVWMMFDLFYYEYMIRDDHGLFIHPT